MPPRDESSVVLYALAPSPTCWEGVGGMPKGGLLRHFNAVLPFNAIVAGGRKVAQSVDTTASLNERRRSKPEGGSIHAD